MFFSSSSAFPYTKMSMSESLYQSPFIVLPNIMIVLAFLSDNSFWISPLLKSCSRA